MEPHICKHCGKECAIEKRVSGEYAVCMECQIVRPVGTVIDTVSIEWPPTISDSDANLLVDPREQEAYKRWLNEKF